MEVTILACRVCSEGIKPCHACGGSGVILIDRDETRSRLTAYSMGLKKT